MMQEGEQDTISGSILARTVLISVLLIQFMAMAGAAEPQDRVLVVGWDGAEWDVIQPLLEEGKMPNLQRLIDEGRSGNLTTTLPIESPVAWSSMTTGTTPGKHGIYGFLERRGNEFVPTTGDDVRTERVWDAVDGEVVVMNVPQTFPPEKVDGYLVSSYLSIPEIGYTYPDELQQEIEEKGYRIEALDDRFDPSKKQEFLDELDSVVENRTRIAIELLDRADWRLGFIVYTGLDRLQHYFWKDMEDDTQYGDAIEEHYVKLDRQLGELIESAGNNATVMVVSDHGFGPLDKNIYMNTWLRKEGYMEMKQKESGGFLASIGLTQQNIVDVLSSMGLLEPIKSFFGLFGFNPGTSLPSPDMSSIDFNASQAYAGNYGGKIYLTDSVEDREGTLQELEERLLEIEDPDTGRKVFGEVYRKDEIYTGKMEDAPDLVLEPNGPYRAVGFLGHRNVVKTPPTKTGTHRRDGIYAVADPGIPAGSSDGAITDVVPTILDVVGEDVPDEVDGETLLD